MKDEPHTRPLQESIAALEAAAKDGQRIQIYHSAASLTVQISGDCHCEASRPDLRSAIEEATKQYATWLAKPEDDQ